MALQDYYFYSVDPATSIEDYLRKSFAGQMVRRAPNGTAPIFALTNMQGTGIATSVEHGYMAKTLVFQSVTLTAGVPDGVTTVFTVAATTNILPGDLLRANTTGEIIRVITVDSATQITVLRGVGQIAAAAIANGVALYGVGNAFEQASKRPGSRLINPVRVMNNTHIFRNSWALPGTLEAIAPIVGDNLSAEGRVDCGFFHAADIEKAILFGQKSGQIVNGQYMTTMDGIVESVRRLAPAANTTVAGGTTNYAQLETMLEPVFDVVTNGRNGNERTLFVGGAARKVINGIGRLSGTYQIIDGATNFGLQFQTFKTSRGTFRMIEHPILNSNPDWARMAICCDIPSMKLMYLAGRKTQNREYGMGGTPVDDGVDAVGGTITTECTMEITAPAANAVIYGLTAAA